MHGVKLTGVCRGASYYRGQRLRFLLYESCHPAYDLVLLLASTIPSPGSTVGAFFVAWHPDK
jgi:hypothetical protein